MAKKPVKVEQPSWGKTLTRDQLLALLDRLDQKRKEREMSKMSDTLKKALAKKQGTHHMENDEAPQVEKKAGKQRAPAIGKKPPTRSAGRGR
jgi:hypothetical protein